MGGSDTKTFDKKYNARIATIMENQDKMASSAYESWYSGGERALEEATAQSNLSLLPSQTELASAQINSSLSLLPGETALSASQTSLGLQKTANQAGIIDDYYSLLGKHDELSSMNEAGAVMANSMANQEAAAMMDAKRRGVGYKSAAGLTVDKAQAIGLAQYAGLQDAKTKNLTELAQGLSM